MNRLKLILAGLLLTFSLAFSQWNLNVRTYSSATSNLINNYKDIEDLYIAPSLQISRMNQDFTFYYRGSTINMINNPIYNRNYHNLGLNYYKDINQDFYFSAGGKLSLRRNHDEYSYYNYNKVSAFAKFKYYPVYYAYVKYGGSLLSKQFEEEDAWNHSEYSLWTQFNLSLPTRTTLRAYFNYRYRNFAPYDYIYDGLRYSGEISSLWLLIGKMRVAQSLGNRVGIFSEFSYHYNPSEGNPYEVEIDSFSPIDDYFGYKGWSWENNAKVKLGQSMFSELNVNFYHRKYLNRPVYQYDFTTEEWKLDDEGYYIIEESNRVDTGYRAQLSAEYKLERLFEKASNLNLEWFFYYQNNSSNDPYFDYEDVGTGLNINYNLQW